jgi:hypothetical protein
MLYGLLADLVLVAHFAFVLFVIGGGLLARRYRWLVLVHLVAVAWGVYIELTPGLLCPLTPLENHFSELAGRAGYEGGFLEHYVGPILYPAGLTPAKQRALAVGVIAVNVLAYALPRRKKARAPG